MTTRSNNGVYYFLGNITSHALHAIPLYQKLGGTFVTTSKAAKSILDDYNLPTIYIDDIPHIWRWQGRRPHRINEYTTLDDRFKKTVNFLNSHAKVVVFYELFDFSGDTTLTQPKKVFLTHGNMLKNYFKMTPRRLEIIEEYDYMAALGPFMKQEFIRSGIDKKKLVDIGIARTDEVISLANKISISDKLTHLGVPANKPIVSYLPTFWGDSSVGELGIQILGNISDDYTVLFRPHPQTLPKIIKKYREVLSRPHIFYLPENGQTHASLLDIYAASSAIIGDASSVMLEAILLNKPLLFAQPDSISNIDSHNQLEKITSISENISPSNVQDIVTIVSNSIKKGINRGLWDKSKATCFFNHDGTSTEKIARFIRSLY